MSCTFAWLFDYKCWQKHVDSFWQTKTDFYGFASICCDVLFQGLFVGMTILYVKNWYADVFVLSSVTFVLWILLVSYAKIHVHYLCICEAVRISSHSIVERHHFLFNPEPSRKDYRGCSCYCSSNFHSSIHYLLPLQPAFAALIHSKRHNASFWNQRNVYLASFCSNLWRAFPQVW